MLTSKWVMGKIHKNIQKKKTKHRKVISLLSMAASINHVEKRGGGVPRKNVCSHVGGREGVEACPRGQKRFAATRRT